LHVDAEQFARDVVVPSEGSSMALVGCGHTQSEQVQVVDPQTLQVLPDNNIGELWVRGPSVATGYWGKPELTAATFHAYTADGVGPYLRTGDLGFWHRNELFITGRSKDLLIFRGKNYYPQDIESIVERSHEALQMNGAAAFMVEDERQTQLVVVAEIRRFALSRLDEKLHLQIAAAICQEVLSVYGLRIAEVVLIKQSTLPKTSSGKVRRNRCRELYLSHSFQLAEVRRGQSPPTVDREPQLASQPATASFAANPTVEYATSLHHQSRTTEDLERMALP
jgi:acyl-CoA synthetase (AMP-forming)/AMP-acid ligase II